MSTIETLPMEAVVSGDGDESVANHTEGDPVQYDQACDPSFDVFPMLRNRNRGDRNSSNSSNNNINNDSALFSTLEKSSTATMAAGPVSLSLVAASAILHRTKVIPRRSRSLSMLTKRAAAALVAPPPVTTALTLLGSIPQEVLARDILGYLTDRAVRNFLDSLGDRRRLTSCSEVFRRFCPKHGSRLEDPSSFRVEHDAVTGEPGHRELSEPTRRCCPECYAEETNLKRCNSCKIFHARFDPLRFQNESNNVNNNNNDGLSNGSGFPGLRCHRCQRMAFCNECLQGDDDDDDGRTSGLSAPTTALGTGPRRKCLPVSGTQQPGRITCRNYCCQNVFTNTICGDYICDDCGDEVRRCVSASTDALSIETCHECGKATCVDSNCLVCSDFRLTHISCPFAPDSAYKIGLGGILSWGGGSRRSGEGTEGNLRDGRGDNDDDDIATNLTAKLRKNLPDWLVWVFFLMALSKMWWFDYQQHDEPDVVVVVEL